MPTSRTAQHAVILAAALLAVLPLLLSGTSCGHDLTFHLLNWMDAAHQWRSGTLRPWWCAQAAWNTGEARFLFYPPLSWMLGALCTLIAGAGRAPVLYTAVALAASGFTMRRFLADYVTPQLALLGACLYLAHPYMLFTATERTAYAELLAAAWLPWLLREALRLAPPPAPPPRAEQAQPSTPRLSSVPHVPLLGHGSLKQSIHLAIPIALLILTNLPAAVLGTYTLAIVLVIRCILLQRSGQPFLKPLLVPAAVGYLAATALSAWYLVPALAQRSAVEVAQAFTSGMRPEDGTLFEHTGQTLHDAVVRQASWLAVLLLTAAAIAACCIVASRRHAHRMHGMRQASLAHHHAPQRRALLPILLTLSAAVLFLLTPASLFVWHHAPELHFLQFPFRTLMLQGVLTVTLIMFAVRSALRSRTAAALSLACVAALAFTAHHQYAQPCDAEDAPANLQAQYTAGQGFEPYDEYTPRDADNDLLHPNLPPAWLANSSDAKAPEAQSAATQSSRIVTVDDGHPSLHSYVLQTTTNDRFIVLRQRAFPNWHAEIDGQSVAPAATRDDGLLTLPLPTTPGSHTLRISYRWSTSQIASAIVSAATLLLLLLSRKTSNRVPNPSRS